MTTMIECTKDEFRAALLAEFGPLWENLPQRDNREFMEVIDGLVRQANNTRGTFRCHSAYLDADFEVGDIRVNEDRTPVTTPTNYRPGVAIRTILDELSYSHMGVNIAIAVGMRAEAREQGIALSLPECDNWIAEYVHEARANR